MYHMMLRISSVLDHFAAFNNVYIIDLAFITAIRTPAYIDTRCELLLRAYFTKNETC